MPLKDIVDIVITTAVGGLTQAGFGTPMILGYTATWVERFRYYTDVLGVAADFATSTPEYQAAAAIFSQNPAPPQIVIGRGALKPTQVFRIAAAVVTNSTKYSFRLGGVQIDYTSDASATNDEIADGLQAAAAATATAQGFTAASTGSAGSKVLTITGNAAGNWTSIEVLDPNLLTGAQTQIDPGIATDLAAIRLADDSWYCLITLFNSALCVAAAAAWTESNEKLYVVDSGDTEIITVADGSATDIAHALKVSGYARTALIYHPHTGKFAAAAFAGACLPLDPGSETWMFKALAGVPSVSLTPSHITNLKAKRANYYYTVAGRAITAEGTVMSSAVGYLDILRFRDWLKVRMQERIFLRLANAKKIAYTDAGIAIIEAEVRAQLRDGVNVGGLTDDFTVTVPKAKDANPTDRANRVLRGVSFNANIAGAVHHLNVSGVISI